jgi:hypothetical protein
VTDWSEEREGEPLDLAGLTDAGMAGLISRISDRTADEFSEALSSVGFCAKPVRLAGHSTTVNTATGEVLSTFHSADAPLGVLHRPCGNRRAAQCPSCSRVYARDTFAMINAGLVGGKTIPDAVGDNPLLFVTLTAPSFGHVHSTGKDGGRCLPRSRAGVCVHGWSKSCMAKHAPDDHLVGAPLCRDCYDWESAVIWQYSVPELWRRTTINLRRGLAARLGVAESRLGEVASLQYAKIAEYQARAMVHFHALIRLDGPKKHGPGSPAPLDGQYVTEIVRDAGKATTFTAAPVDADDAPRVIAWGQQLDIKVVRKGSRRDEPGESLEPSQVAGYLAKYATKDASSIRDPSRPSPHLIHLGQTCRDLAKRSILHDRSNDYRYLSKWSHMLGFRGHFSTKSRQYSVTLGRLRRARHRYRTLVEQAKRAGEVLDLRDLEARLLADDDEETTLVVGSWAYQGSGWTRPGDETLALAAAARAREYAQRDAAAKHQMSNQSS